MPAKYLTPEQWAEEHSQPIKTVWRLIREGRIKAVNIGTLRRPLYRIPLREVEQYDKRNAA